MSPRVVLYWRCATQRSAYNTLRNGFIDSQAHQAHTITATELNLFLINYTRSNNNNNNNNAFIQ